MKPINIVVAVAAENFGIGRNGTIPWHLVADLKNFKNITTATNALDPSKKNAVVMGRKTWESIPEKYRPLSGRANVILTRNLDLRSTTDVPDSAIVSHSLQDAIRGLSTDPAISEIFVIGGEAVYREAISCDLCSNIFMTIVESPVGEMDTFFPQISATKYLLCERSPLMNENGLEFRFTKFKRVADDLPLSPPQIHVQNVEEQQYLDAISRILRTGVIRGDRTGTGTISLFGLQMRFSLRDNVFPLLTTKKVFWRGVAEELLWFVKGSTNANELASKDIHIWDGNGSREFLDKRGLIDRVEGDLGPVYGFQWRHFGAKYSDMNADYSGCGIDQLADCIDKIKNSPEDRRIIMTAWNPSDLDKMALPPCHMFAQFYVANGELSCQMYQRSADMGLGVPFNIASYSLLTRMVAQVCGLKPGDFIHTIGDAHIYLNHIESLEQQIVRVPTAFPKLTIDPTVTDIDGFEFRHFSIEGYHPQGSIKMKMAV